MGHKIILQNFSAPNSYGAWIDKAESYRKRGIGQLKCSKCHLWLYPDERKNHKCEAPEEQTDVPNNKGD